MDPKKNAPRGNAGQDDGQQSKYNAEGAEASSNWSGHDACVVEVTPENESQIVELLHHLNLIWEREEQEQEVAFERWLFAKFDADPELDNVNEHEAWFDWQRAGCPGWRGVADPQPFNYSVEELEEIADNDAYGKAWDAKYTIEGSSDELRAYCWNDWKAEGKPGPESIRLNHNPPAVPTIALLPSNAPLDIARHVLATLYPNGTIHFWRSEWYVYDAGVYRVIDETTLAVTISPILEKAQFQREKKDAIVTIPIVPTIALKREVLDAMKSLPGVLLPLCTDAHSWIKGGHEYPAEELIVMKRCILHRPTRTRIPHTPHFFATSALPFNYEPDAAEPETYMNWQMQIWPGDGGIQNTLTSEEYLGYCLQSSLDLQIALWLIGATGGGKGVYQRLAKALVGAENACGPTMTSLSTNFGAKCLIGKRLAIVGDARLSGRADAIQLTERLLSILGGDLIEIDRKGEDAWGGTLGVKFIFAANKIPKLEDVSGALARRFLYLDFDQTFNPQDDPHLEERLHAELPGIFNRALDGLDRLIERGHFIQPPSVARDNAEAINNPIALFADEYLVIDPKATANVQSVHTAYLEWCRDNNRDHTPTVQSLSAMLRERVPALTTKQFRDGSGARRRFFVGIGLATCHAASRDCHAHVTDENAA